MVLYCMVYYLPDDSAIGVALTAVATVTSGLFQANVLTLRPAATRASILVSSGTKGLPVRDLDFGFFLGFPLICFNQLSRKC